MGKAQKKWAREKKAELFLVLGGTCHSKGCTNTKRLEFDCIIPQGDAHHKLDQARRMSFYLRQLENNNLQLLCPKCHAKKSVKEQADEPYVPPERIPF